MIVDAISAQPSEQIAIETPYQKISYRQLVDEVDRVYQWLKTRDVKVLALQSENTPEWIYIDLACQKANVIFIPLPTFFASGQLTHILDLVKPDIVVRPQGLSGMDNGVVPFLLPLYEYYQLDQTRLSDFPKGTSKVTFTSGSTGQPKGVCLSIANQFAVANALVERIGIKAPKHFCLLSFSTLLENIAGIYAPLMAGGSLFVASDVYRGFDGATIHSPNLLLSAITGASPHTMILVPELLQFLLHANAGGWEIPASLLFMAVGGSRVSSVLMSQARAAGLPIYQGYGLSECASVVSLCADDTCDMSSAGKLLSHVDADIQDGQLTVTGNTFLGYLGMPDSWYPSAVKTGDIVQYNEGCLEILGRNSNLIINSFGRNISPEWVESEFLSTGAFAHVVVFGDAKPFLTALLVPSIDTLTAQAIEEIVGQVNQILPEFARVKDFVVVREPLSKGKGQLTTNGRPRRQQVLEDFGGRILSLYPCQNIKETEHESI